MNPLDPFRMQRGYELECNAYELAVAEAALRELHKNAQFFTDHDGASPKRLECLVEDLIERGIEQIYAEEELLHSEGREEEE